ncbi:MAG: alpha/beta hydrolase [Pigmentiphaga sp.]
MIKSRSSSLHPALAPWLAGINQIAVQAAARGIEPTPAAAREALANMTLYFGGKAPEIAAVRDFTLPSLPGVPLRVYDPRPGQPLPVCVYLHGGGHMAGSIEVYDPIYRQIAAHADCLVVAVEYRLAPEHPYPQGLEDCVQAIRELPPWLASWNLGDGRGLLVTGDSGGGALAASISALAANDRSLAVRGQILIYPSLDYTLSQPSVVENGQGYLLETARIRWYFDQYFGAHDDRRAASPLFMPAAGLPPTLLITAGFCPLRDEGYAYAERLAAAGVPCEHVNLPDMLHTYLNLHALAPEACDATYNAMAHWIAKHQNLPASK